MNELEFMSSVDVQVSRMANAFWDRHWSFVYGQETGVFAIGAESHDDAGSFTAGCVLDVGYSGFGAHLNRAASEHIVGQGPIPRGTWFIGEVQNRSDTGPISIRLIRAEGEPVPGRRSGFLIHGDNRKRNQTASSGCIILPRYVREFVSHYRGRQLVVI